MCQPQRLVLQTNDRRKAMPMRSPSTFRLSDASPVVHNVSNLEKLSSGSAPCARDLASTALDKARSYLSEVIDLCATDIIAMRSENVLSRVTRSCRESLPVWSSSENPLCRREHPLSSMAKSQAQVTAAVSHVTRCICSGTNLTLNSSSNRLACVFQIPPCRSQTAFCCGVIAAVGMGSHPKSSSSCPNSRSNSPPWSQINLRGTRKGVIQC